MQSGVSVGAKVGKAFDEVGGGRCTGPTVDEAVFEESVVILDAKRVAPEAVVEVVEDSRRGGVGLDGQDDSGLDGEVDKEVNMLDSVVL